MYKLNDKFVRIKDVPQEVLDYGQEVVNNVKYEPDPAWVLDVCETKGHLKVLEVGSFSCSGLYAADPETVILKINELFKDK